MQVGTVCSIGSVVLKLHRYQIVPKQTKDMEHYELTKSFQFYNFTKKLMMSSFPSFSSFFLKLNCVSCMYILDIIYLLGILPLTICLKIVPLDIQAIMCQKRGSFPHEFKIDTKCLEKTPQNMSLSLFSLHNSYSFCHIMLTICFLLTWTQSLNPTLAAAAVDLGYINSIQRALNFALSFQICKVCF